MRYRSLDGGVSWDSGSTERVQWGGRSAETPAGLYTIQGSDLILIGPDGASRIAYASSYLQEEANLWAQEHSTTQLGLREMATGPLSIVYDKRTGNVIAAMGIQGVVVGRPDGMWTRYAVGRYSPTDFSFFAKTRLLLSNVGFLAAALAISLSMTGVALSLSQYRRQDFPLLAGVPVSVLSLLIVLPVALAVTGQRAILEMILRLWLTLAFALIVSAIVLAIVSKDDRVSKSAGLTIGILALLASCWSMLVFSGSDADPSRNYTLFIAAVRHCRVRPGNVGPGSRKASAEALAGGAPDHAGYEPACRSGVHAVAALGYRLSPLAGVVHSANRPSGPRADRVPEAPAAARVAGFTPAPCVVTPSGISVVSRRLKGRTAALLTRRIVPGYAASSLFLPVYSILWE